MLDVEKIELSPIQATAYWWINVIRYRVREIVIYGAHNQKEVDFVEIFYGFSEIDYRKMYLALTEYISKDVENYIPKGINDCFNQDTNIHGHKKINDSISKIVGKKIPDIRLAADDVKDSVIYTTMDYVNVFYKSCGVRKLPLNYEPSYVLTGDDKGLEFYNLLISTVAVLSKEDKSFNSVYILRERFCNEYLRLTNVAENLEDIILLFNYCFDKASDKDLIIGRSFKETYFASFRDIDFVSLYSYMDKAQYYACVILDKVDINDNSLSKSLN